MDDWQSVVASIALGDGYRLYILDGDELRERS
jgi:hypothetical protein